MAVSKSAVKEMAGNCRVSANFYPALEAKVAALIEDAKKRAEANNRATLMPHDL